jgi:hypothetical protein
MPGISFSVDIPIPSSLSATCGDVAVVHVDMIPRRWVGRVFITAKHDYFTACVVFSRWLELFCIYPNNIIPRIRCVLQFLQYF